MILGTNCGARVPFTALLIESNKPRDQVSYVSLYRTEPVSFKTRFAGWEDIMSVDFTRTPEMMEKRAVELVSHTHTHTHQPFTLLYLLLMCV